MNREYFTRQREEERSFSRAVKVKGGSTVYLSGVVDRDADGKPVIGDFGTKARATFERLREAIEVTGGTLDDIIMMTVFITDSRYGPDFLKIRSEYFKPGHYPTNTLITVSGLASPELQVEIQATAILDD